MKAKTIRLALRAKVDEWLATIEDRDVRAVAARGTIVTGGCIASMLLREKVNDYDLYFRDRATAEAVVRYYVARFKPVSVSGIACRIEVRAEEDRVRIYVRSAGIASESGAEAPYDYFEARPADEAATYVGEVMDDPGAIEDANAEIEALAQEAVDDGRPHYRPVFVSTNAVTLSHRVQVICRFFGEPDAIHENYDFAHCTCYWKSWDDELVLRPEALEALLTRELRYVGSRYPLCSLIRLRKFVGRGWTVNAGQILKMAMQLSALDLTDVAVLQDQLTGVDAAYFSQVFRAVKDRYPERLEAAYLVEIIDRMF